MSRRALDWSSLPRRDRGMVWLGLMNAVNSVGDGAFAALSVVYLSREVGLSPSIISAVLAVSGAVAMLTGIPIGMYADRVGLKRVFASLCLVEGITVACYPYLRDWHVYLPLAVVGTCAMRGTAGVRNALIARTVTPDQRVRSRAFLRAVTNAGTAVGAGVAGILLVNPTVETLSLVFYADAGTFAVAAACAAALHVRPVAHRVEFHAADLARDRAFLVVSLSQAALSLHSVLLTVALPLWIATRTTAPLSLYGLILSGSTVLAVLLQVPVSRVARSGKAIKRASWVAGVLITVMCLLLAPTADTSGRVTAALIVAAALVRVLADLLQSTAGWAVSFAAPPPGHEATYQATYSTAFTLATAIGPAISGWIVTGPGGLGWIIAGIAFAAVGQLASRAGQAVLTRPGHRGDGS